MLPEGVPVAPEPEGATVAVRVTGWPMEAGLGEAVRTAAVGESETGETVKSVAEYPGKL
jgi:hypothetical protein